jgi:predicted component of type VI protein secretion system
LRWGQYGMNITLHVTSKKGGPAQDFVFSLKENLVSSPDADTATSTTSFEVLGRGPESPVSLEGSEVSREHLAFHAERGIVFITDLSANGTWLNGTRLARNTKTLIQSGDTVEIPGYALRFDADAEVASVAILAPAAQPIQELVSTERAPISGRAADSNPDSAAGNAAPAPLELAGTPPGATQRKKSFLAPVAALVASFTGLEKLLVILAIASIALLVLYSQA